MGCGHDDDHDGKTSSLWYVGVILSIIGSVATNMGVNLQKYSFMSEAKRSVSKKRGYFRQPLWVFGLSLVIGGSGLDFVALGFLPQSLATPVGGSTMVANVAFASLFLKERFSRHDALGTALVLAGICLAAAFAEKESGCYTVDQLFSLYGEPLFIMYIILMGAACLGLFAFSKRLESIITRKGKSSPSYKRFARLHPVCYPALSGIFGAQSVLCAKSVAELIKTTAEGTNQFGNYGTYLISISMFICIFMQIHWLAHGLQMFDAVFVVPVFQCFFISVSIFGGGVYFKEFAKMTTLSLGMFFLGASITLSGVFILSKREMNKLPPKGKLRAAVKTVIFIKRCQKALNLDYRWVLPISKADAKCIRPPGSSSPTTDCLKGSKNMNGGSNSPFTMRKPSKASVVPVDHIVPSGISNDGHEDFGNITSSSSSHIELTPKK